MELNEKSHIIQSAESLDAAVSPTDSETRHLVDEDHVPDEQRRGNMPMTSFNFINSILGSGIIGTPYALKQAGLGVGIILIILVAAISDYSVLLLIEAGHLSKTSSYQDLMHASFGRVGHAIVTLIQFSYPFISMVSYNVIIGDTIRQLVVRIGGDAVSEMVIANRIFIICAFTLIVTLPLSLYRNIVNLSKVSFIGIVCVLLIIIAMIGKAFEYKNVVPETPHAWQLANVNISQAIGVIAFAYMCMHNSFLIHGSLEEPTGHRWRTVTHVSFLFSALCMLVLGIVGYATFRGFTEGDVLENYCNGDDIINVARAGFCLTIMFTYPVECFVVREVIENAFFSERPQTLCRHICISLAVVVAVTLVSMTTDCLGIVLELNGIVTATPLAFVLPPLCYLRLQHDSILSRKNAAPLAVLFFGAAVGVFGSAWFVLSLVRGESCSHGAGMPYCQSDIRPVVWNVTNATTHWMTTNAAVTSS